MTTGNEVARQHRDTGSVALLVNTDMARPMSVIERQAQINVIQELMRNNMQDKVHYGKVFAGAKPSLWKPGAELIAMTLRIAIDHVIEDLSGPDDVRYRVKAVATRQADGLFLGATYGECWSAEQKYQWREAIVKAEWEATPADRRREKYEKTNDREGYKVVLQVRAHPADVSNTILKMGCKRADIGVILLVTGASDIFSQDIEDIPPEMRISDLDREAAIDLQERPAAAEPQRASQQQAEEKPKGAGLYVTGTRIGKKVAEERKDGEVVKKGWTLFKITTSDGVERATFSQAAYETAQKAQAGNFPIGFDGEEGPKGFAITKLEILA